MAGRMNHKQAIQLADWLRSNREMIQRKAISEVVDSIHADLGFMANPSSVLRVAETVGLGLKMTLPNSPVKQGQIVQLATCLAELYQRLGENCPKQLSNLLDETEQ